MRFPLFPTAKPKLHCVALLAALLCAALTSAKAQDDAALVDEAVALASAPLVSNATPRDLRAVESVLADLETDFASRDAKSLRLFGWADDATKYRALGVRTKLTHLVVSAAGALARQNYEIRGVTAPDSPSSVLKSGTQEIALRRVENGAWELSGRRFEPPADAREILIAAAREDWQLAQKGDAADGETAGREEVVLHLVAERRGGRWIALRRSRWSGHVVASANLAMRERGSDLSGWIANQLERHAQNGGGTLHLLLQRGARDWVGLDGVWQPDAHGQNNRNDAPAQANLAAQRAAMNGAAYLDANEHRNWAQALTEAGLFGEAADAWEKTAILQPALADAALLKQAIEKRADDPATRAVQQLEDEAKVGLVADHPSFMIDTLDREQKARPTPLRALRIGLEFSKLGDDVRAVSWLNYGERLLRQPRAPRLSPDDAAWIEVLHAHLVERKKLALLKPQNALRSALFTVRCRDDDAAVLPLLAALEAAQHTVYADFRVPMGATEVVLWRTQSEFQSYTSRFSAQGASEFVAALTLTKLISTSDGPLVLGEEVNVFIDPRLAKNTFGTVAHEYGHVAVRQVSRARNVPVWFNEGVATVVEGGYDGAVARVRRARGSGKLLSMAEMRNWNVDGERAFLAYSQANSMVNFIVATWGADSILEILRRIGRNETPEDTFRQVLGISTGQLWSRWRNEGIQ